MRIRTALPVLLLALCLAVPAAAQESAAVLAAKSHVRTLMADGFASADLDDLHATDAHFDRASGATYVYLTQRYNGIEVWGAIAPAAVSPAGKVHALAPRRYTSGLARRVNATEAALGSGAATALAESHLRSVAPATTHRRVRTDEPGEILPTAMPVVYETTEPRLVYQPLEDGSLRLAWAMELTSTTGAQMWAVRVDALTGSVLATDDLVVRDTWHTPAPSISLAPLAPEAPAHAHGASAAQAGSYHVVAWPAESPNHGDYTVVADPEDAIASQLGWHDTGTQQFTITRGNNVWAFLDRDDDNAPDPNGEPDGGASLTFDFPYDFDQEPVENTDASVTNLFYWGNLFHDITYQYGFDEAAGNFQTNNFGNGGVGNDAARLRAQNGADICNGASCENNASFGTPSDGGAGRMQMYEWSGVVFSVTAPASVAGVYPSAGAAFGPERLATGPLVTVETPGGQPGRACTSADIGNGAALRGNIALLERGDCNFVDKVRNVEAAGAIAAVVYNNDRKGAGEDGEPEDLVSMGLPDGEVDNVNIPSTFVQQSTGILLRGTAGVEISTGPQIRRSSSMDAGVVAHEFAHGLSNRLTGGASAAGCLGNQEQMGEGWSDYYGLLLSMQTGDDIPRGIGTYLQYEDVDGPGIRPAPYTRDFALNSFTYQDVITNTTSGLSVPHGIGSVWAATLWDMTLDLVDTYGFDQDVYNADGGAGNQIALHLVTQGLKLQPCSPGFVDGRDAILAADDLLYDGANKQLIWAAFARRGLGFNASQGSSSLLSDGTADFTVPVANEESPNTSGARLAIAGPNPVRSETAIALTLASPEAVTVEVLDLLGRSVQTLHTGALTAARHTLDLDAGGLAPGVYVVRAEGDTFSATQRITIVR